MNRHNSIQKIISYVVVISKFVKNHFISLVLLTGFIYICYRCHKAEVNSDLNRNDYYAVCRDSDAVVLTGSPFLSKGTVYVFEKDKSGKFFIEQRIGLAKYLRKINLGFVSLFGDYVVFAHSDVKGQFEDFFTKQPLAYNDHFLVVMTRRSNNPGSSGFYVGDAIVFKKQRDKFEFHKRIKDVCPSRASLTQDDQLILSEPRGMFGSNEGCLRCYNLAKGRVKLAQTIKTPAEIKDCFGNLVKSTDVKLEIGSYFQTNDNLLLVRCVAKGGRILMENDEAPYHTDVTGYILYRRNNGVWEFFQSTYEIIPRDVYVSSKRTFCYSVHYDPLESPIKIDISRDVVQLSCINRRTLQKQLIELVRNQNSGFFEFNERRIRSFVKANIEKTSDDSYDDSTRVNLAIQSRKNYSLCVMNKSTQLGISPPSFSDNPDIITPKWVIPSGNEETMDLIIDYYKNNYVKDYVPRNLFNNFYEYVNYVPDLHYSIHGDNMVVTYVFPDCFFKGSPMQRPDIVWAGVDFYKLDPERGPIKTSSFTTSNLEPLKEVPFESP